jgi:hypothetical protein
MTIPLPFGVHYTNSTTGLSLTGLADVTFDIHRVALADITHSEVVTSGVATEIGDGIYAYVLTVADDALKSYFYTAVAKTASANASPKDLPAGWFLYPQGNAVELARLDTPVSNVETDTQDIQARLPAALVSGRMDSYIGAMAASTDVLLNAVPGSYAAGTAGAALGRIGSGQIVTTSIVASNGDTTTYRGDDYNDTDGRRIDWTDASVSWPTLTGATITIQIGGDVSFSGTVITATGANKKVGIELTAAQTLTIPEGRIPFVVVATLTSGRVVTLVDAYWTSVRRLIVGF